MKLGPFFLTSKAKKIEKFRQFLRVATLLFMVFSVQAWATDPIHLTLLHTNDLHSHFRPDRGPLGLGGVARLKTAIDREKRAQPHTLLLDGGDWSEGSIYFTEDAGGESMRMMDRLGYDVAVLGNHEWLSGPDTLLNSLEKTKPRMSIVAANVSLGNYPRQPLFREWIPPFVVREVAGVKIAFIGLVTYEYIYDKYFSPVTITPPRDALKRLVTKLRREVDSIIVISHNNLQANEALLQAFPEVDLIIGGHDHKKLIHPITVPRRGSSPSWLVETGRWGEFLGKVDVEITPKSGRSKDKSTNKSGQSQIKFLNYQLIQLDSSIPEDPEINEILDKLEDRIEQRVNYPIFHDCVGESEIELTSPGVDNRMGNFVTDAYLEYTGADLALESVKFIYGQLHSGAIRTVDAFNAHPGVYDPNTERSWTLRTIPVSGRLLKWLLYFLHSTNYVSSLGLVNTSGLEAIYDPYFKAQYHLGEVLLLPSLHSSQSSSGIIGGIIDGITDWLNAGTVRDIKIRGEPLDPNRTYRVATGGGLIEGIQFFNSYSPVSIRLDNIFDTQVENWRILLDYIRTKTPLNLQSISPQKRIRTLQADLSITYDDVQWKPISRVENGTLGTIHARVTNAGATASVAGTSHEGPSVRILGNRNGINYSIDPDYFELGSAYPIPSLAPGEQVDYWWDVVLPEHRGYREVTIQIGGTVNEINRTNDQVTRWVKAN